MFFDQIEAAPPDPIFGLLEAFQEDPRKEKVSLMVGIYKDEHLKAELFPSVRKSEEQVTDLMADYLPIDGDHEFISLLEPVIFGKREERIYGAHTTGGTGALRAGAEFILKEVSKNVYLPNHTWPNHHLVFERAGCKIEKYPYYNAKKRGFDLDGMLEFLKKVPEKSVILLHACCHNPTGSDPTMVEWKEISDMMKMRRLFPFFDCAYQGLGDGLEQDAKAMRLFVKEGHEMLVAYSCSKNFGMYCQRVGALFAIGAEKDKVASQIKRIIRALYSNPPAHGAKVVRGVLGSEELKKLWYKDLEQVRSRLNKARSELIQKLGNYDHLKSHKGMFSFIDLNPLQVEKLREKFAIYMTDNGRISVAGLSSKNIDYVVTGLLAVCGEQRHTHS